MLECGSANRCDGMQRQPLEIAGGSIRARVDRCYGKNVQDFTDMLVNHPPKVMQERQQSRTPETPFSNLEAEIGSRLLPVVGESVRALSTLFDAHRDLRENDLANCRLRNRHGRCDPKRL